MSTTFNLDGFHNRTVAGWREVKTRTEHAASTAPGYWAQTGRYVPPRTLPAFAVIECHPWRTIAKLHAAKYGAAGVWHCDDSLTLFYRDGDKVRTKTFQNARPIKTA